MEGVHLGAIWLGMLAMLILGLTSIVAFGFLLAGNHRQSRLSLATGLLGSAVMASLASLSFLNDGRAFGSRGTEYIYLLIAISLLLAGGSQFIAALKVSGRRYFASLGWALVAAVLLLAAIPATEPFGSHLLLDTFVMNKPRTLVVLTASLAFGVLSRVAAEPPRAGEKKPVDRDFDLE